MSTFCNVQMCAALRWGRWGLAPEYLLAPSNCDNFEVNFMKTKIQFLKSVLWHVTRFNWLFQIKKQLLQRNATLQLIVLIRVNSSTYYCPQHNIITTESWKEKETNWNALKNAIFWCALSALFTASLFINFYNIKSNHTAVVSPSLDKLF